MIASELFSSDLHVDNDKNLCPDFSVRLAVLEKFIVCSYRLLYFLGCSCVCLFTGVDISVIKRFFATFTKTCVTKFIAYLLIEFEDSLSFHLFYRLYVLDSFCVDRICFFTEVFAIELIETPFRYSDISIIFIIKTTVLFSKRKS